ncbi:uracil-DNA glycosylase [Streptosporangium sp. G11]|uniref:uracil-DNA glycosylase n=1 Tax=Streptosporangium sp. G11 TaxID=3436926 RepID=UPI003EBBF23D
MGLFALFRGRVDCQHGPVTIRNHLAWEAGVLLDAQHLPGVLEARRGAIYDPHVRSLNRLVERICSAESESVPWFDPSSGGVNSRVLLLLQDPSEAASTGSGFISRHNNDPTAHNTFYAAREAGLSYTESVHWNVIPWWVKDPSMISGVRRTLGTETKRSARYLCEVLSHLDKLEVIVLLGRVAQGAWQSALKVNPDLSPSDVRILKCPHTASRAWNNVDRQTGRLNKDLIIETLREAAEGRTKQSSS